MAVNAPTPQKTSSSGVHDRLERAQKLPKPLRDYIWSGQVERAFQNVLSKQQVSNQRLRTVSAQLVGQVLFGELHPNSFIRKLAEQGSVDIERARSIARDVSAQVFAPVRNELMKVYEISGEDKQAQPTIPAIPKQKTPPSAGPRPKKTFLPGKKPDLPNVPAPPTKPKPSGPPLSEQKKLQAQPEAQKATPGVPQAPKQVVQPVIAQIHQAPQQAPQAPPPAAPAPAAAPTPASAPAPAETKAPQQSAPAPKPAAPAKSGAQKAVAQKPFSRPAPAAAPAAPSTKLPEPAAPASHGPTVEHAPVKGSIAEAAAQMHSGKKSIPEMRKPSPSTPKPQKPPVSTALPKQENRPHPQVIKPAQVFKETPQVAQQKETKPKGPALSPSELLAAEEVVAKDDGKKGGFLSGLFKKKKKSADTPEPPQPQNPSGAAGAGSSEPNSGNTLNLRRPNLPS